MVDRLIYNERRKVLSESVNREYKDRLFSFIFGREENKQWTLSLYNAVNGTHYADENDIVITTMSDTIYMGMKNDVSFLISDILSLYEQQSTYNPNMPVRQLMYLGRQYDKYIKETRQNIYGKKQIHLPVPKLITFYNGAEDIEDTVLKLSDSFLDSSHKADVQVSVRLININSDKNIDLLKTCAPLKEYTWFVENVRNNKQHLNMSMEAAVDEAINTMPSDFLIKKFLDGNRAEVKNMCITEYNEAETMQMFKEEGREEGIAEGLAKGIEKGIARGMAKGKTEGILLSIKNLMKNLNCSPEEAMKMIDIPQSDYEKYLQML